MYSSILDPMVSKLFETDLNLFLLLRLEQILSP